MPNHITNQITFGSDSAALTAFQRMLHDMRMEGQPLGSFDFNKLLPMPGELNIECGSRTDAGLKLYTGFIRESAIVAEATMFAAEDERTAAVAKLLAKWDAIEKNDPDTWALGEKAFRNIQKYGHPTWYEWCNQNWGSKWNAYQPRPLREDDHTMVFYTAWASVPKIISLLSRKYPEQTITYRWADEDIGHNVGEFTIKDGEVIDINVPEGGSREAYEMAAEIMDISLSDYNLHLTRNGSGYEYRDPDEAPAVDKSSLKPPPAPAERAKPIRKKRSAKGQDR